MKKNILGLIVFSLVIIIGPFWKPTAKYLRLYSSHSKESLDEFEKSMNLVQDEMTAQEIIKIVGKPHFVRKSRTSEQLVFIWKGSPNFAIDPSKIDQYVCQYTFIIGDKGVQGRGISR